MESKASALDRHPNLNT